MNTTYLRSLTSTRVISLSSSHDRYKPKTRSKDSYTAPRSESVYGSKSYNDALQRAFNKVKYQVFFNPDMCYFTTITYATVKTDISEVLRDMKIFIKNEKRGNSTNPKYIYILEYQKRGSIHIHMISNKFFSTYTNPNGYQSLTNWKHGKITSVLHISDLDSNFKPYLYLFKYMRKSQRIGKSFVHTSRNLNKFTEHTPTSNQSFQNLHNLVHTEEHKLNLPGMKTNYKRDYYKGNALNETFFSN